MITKIRYVVHPDDESELYVTAGDSLKEIEVFIDTRSDKVFITQVEDRLTVPDDALRVLGGYVKHPSVTTEL